MNNLFSKLALVLFCYIFILNSTQDAFAQKKHKKNRTAKEEVVAKISEEDQDQSSLEAEYYLIDGMKSYMLEEYPKALESFQKALVLSKGSAAIHYKIAETYVQIGDIDKAEVYAENALEGDKENKYYYILLAKIYENKQKYEKAIDIYEELIDTQAGLEEYYFELASIYLRQDKYNKAIEAYDKLEKVVGINESVISQKQKIYIRLNQIDKAIAEGKKLVKAKPDDPRHLISLSELLIANNKSNQALPILEAAANNHSFDPRVYLLLARVYSEQGEDEKAFSQMKIAFANAELDANSKINLIMSYVQEKDIDTFQDTIAELAKIIVETHPYHAESQTLYADVLLMNNQNEEALKYYLKSIESDNSQANIWKQVLALEAGKNALDSLIKHSEEALELFPNQATFWLYNGIANFGKKNYDDAVIALEEGKRLAFNNKELLNEFNVSLGDVYQGLEQYKESNAAYEKVLEDNSNHPQALNNYSYYLALRKENLPLAKQMASRLVESNPENPMYLDTYGWVLYQAKDYKKARKQLEKAVQKINSGTISEHYGDVLFKLGETEAALEQWQKAKKQGGASGFIDKKIKNKNLYE